MIEIILASICVSIGAFFLRKGDLIGFLLIFFNKSQLNQLILIYTLVGILLNLVGIYFWQASIKSNLSYPVAISLYLTLTLFFGIIFSSFFEKTKIGLNLLIGCGLIAAGIVFLAKRN